MKKTFLLAIALFLSLCSGAQTTENVSFTALVYAEQLMSENASSTYMLKTATDAAGNAVARSEANIDGKVTTLDIDMSAIEGEVKSVSICSLKKTVIAGPFKYDAATDKTTNQTGKAPTIYCNNMRSDVVTVVGTDKKCRAYLLPTTVKGGIVVTVRTGNDELLSQTFSDEIGGGSTIELTVDAPTATNLWMATIPGNTYFSFVSTPGAHDAATSGVGGWGSEYAKCQGEDIETLLKNGVRAFDLRPNYMNNNAITSDNLYIYHGTYNTNVRYVDAMQTLVNFVKDNPSEAISVVMVKEKGEGNTDRSSEMWSVINACHNQHSTYMKLLNSATLMLDDFRGKICYLNRTGTECNNTVRITNWPDDGNVTNYSSAIGTACAANIQDKYNQNGSSKQNEVKSMLEISSQNTAKKNYHFNFTSSAYKLFGSAPATYASQTNPVIANYLNEGNIEGPTGYVYGDFMGSTSNGGKELLQAIVNQNYRYAFKGRGRSEQNKPEEAEETTVENIRDNKKAECSVYDLGGRKQNTLQKGINVVDGRKILKK